MTEEVKDVAQRERETKEQRWVDDMLFDLRQESERLISKIDAAMAANAATGRPMAAVKRAVMDVQAVGLELRKGYRP